MDAICFEKNDYQYVKVGDYGLQRIDFDGKYPYQKYYKIDNREIAVLIDGNGFTDFVFDNDPEKTIYFGEAFDIGHGWFYCSSDGRYIHAPVFKEAEPKVSSSYMPHRVDAIVETFFDNDSLSVGNIVKEKMKNDVAEQNRVNELKEYYRKNYGSYAELLFVKYNL